MCPPTQQVRGIRTCKHEATFWTLHTNCFHYNHRHSLYSTSKYAKSKDCDMWSAPVSQTPLNWTKTLWKYYNVAHQSDLLPTAIYGPTQLQVCSYPNEHAWTSSWIHVRMSSLRYRKSLIDISPLVQSYQLGYWFNIIISIISIPCLGCCINSVGIMWNYEVGPHSGVTQGFQESQTVLKASILGASQARRQWVVGGVVGAWLCPRSR